MPTQQDRINTIIAIVNSSPSLTNANVNKLKTEFKQVMDVDTITPPKRKHILKEKCLEISISPSKEKNLEAEINELDDEIGILQSLLQEELLKQD